MLFLTDYLHRHFGTSVAESSQLFSLVGVGSLVGALHNQAERREVPDWYLVPRHDAFAYREKIERFEKENPIAS